MKKIGLLLTALAFLACNSGGGNPSENPAAKKLASPRTLGCGAGIFGKAGDKTTFETLVDGEAGTYKLVTADVYAEMDFRSGRRANFLLVNTVDYTAPTFSMTQVMSCFDNAEIRNGYFHAAIELPLSLRRLDGRISDDIALAAQISKGMAIIEHPEYIKADKTLPKFIDLKSFVSIPRDRHATEYRFFIVSPTSFIMMIKDDEAVGNGDRIKKVIRAQYRLVP